MTSIFLHYGEQLWWELCVNSWITCTLSLKLYQEIGSLRILRGCRRFCCFCSVVCSNNGVVRLGRSAVVNWDLCKIFLIDVLFHERKRSYRTLSKRKSSVNDHSDCFISYAAKAIWGRPVSCSSPFLFILTPKRENHGICSVMLFKLEVSHLKIWSPPDSESNGTTNRMGRREELLLCNSLSIKRKYFLKQFFLWIIIKG